jgi:hypothetical protein
MACGVLECGGMTPFWMGAASGLKVGKWFDFPGDPTLGRVAHHPPRLPPPERRHALSIPHISWRAEN